MVAILERGENMKDTFDSVMAAIKPYLGDSSVKPNEVAIVMDWIERGISLERIIEAFERAIMSTQKISFPYANAVLKSEQPKKNKTIPLKEQPKRNKIKGDLHWRYQAVYKEDGDEGGDIETSRAYTVCEVYLDEDGKLIGSTENAAIAPYGWDLEELKADIQLMLDDVSKWEPVPFDSMQVGMTFSRRYNDITIAALNESEELIRSDRRRFSSSADMVTELKSEED